MTRENVLGGLIILVVLAALGFLILKPGQQDGSGKLRSSSSAQSNDRRSILLPDLLSQLSQGQQGAVVTTSGKGSLGSGESWRYFNSWPNPDLKVQNAEGKTVKIPVSGLGVGGSLILTSSKKLSPSSATTLARKALNDPKLRVAVSSKQGQLISKRLVASSVSASVSGKRLVFKGLFSARACKTANQPALVNACQTRAR